jgi:hypothetical protein
MTYERWIAGGTLLVLLAIAAAAAMTSACGQDACGCLCSAPADGAIIAPCSAGVVVDPDASNADDLSIAGD